MRDIGVSGTVKFKEPVTSNTPKLLHLKVRETKLDTQTIAQLSALHKDRRTGRLEQQDKLSVGTTADFLENSVKANTEEQLHSTQLNQLIEKYNKLKKTINQNNKYNIQKLAKFFLLNKTYEEDSKVSSRAKRIPIPKDESSDYSTDDATAQIKLAKIKKTRRSLHPKPSNKQMERRVRSPKSNMHI